MDSETLEMLATIALAAATIGLALWVCLPSFLPSIGLAFFDCGGDPDDERARTEEDPHYLDLRGQLENLGFRSVGSGWEKTIGSPRSQSSLFCHAQLGCYAGMWRLAGGDYRAYFNTIFEDGAAVFTANYSRPLVQTSNYRAAGTPTHSMPVLLAEHSRAVAEFVERGHIVQPCKDLDDVLNAKKVYFHNPTVQSRYRSDKFVVFQRRFKEMVVGPGIVIVGALYLGKGHLYAWGAGFLIAVLLGIAFNRVQMKRARAALMAAKSAEQRQADMKRAPSSRR